MFTKIYNCPSLNFLVLVAFEPQSLHVLPKHSASLFCDADNGTNIDR